MKMDDIGPPHVDPIQNQDQPTRRVTRKSARIAAAAITSVVKKEDDEDENDTDHDNDDEMDVETPTTTTTGKRNRKKSQTRSTSKRVRKDDAYIYDNDNDYGNAARSKNAIAKGGKTKKTALKVCFIHQMPFELLSMILSFLEPKDLLQCFTVSKQLYSALNPQSDEGKRTWRLTRQQSGYPDPGLVGKTDFEFFKIYCSRGCDFCNHHPQTRKVYWGLHGYKLCEGCLGRHTIRSYELKRAGIHVDRYQHLPSARMSMRSFHRRSEMFEFDVYLKSDVLDHDPTGEEIAELQSKIPDVRTFERGLELAEDRISVAKQRREKRMRILRKRQIKEFILKEISTLDETFLHQLKAFQTACKQPTPFTNRGAQTRLLKQITAELKGKVASFARHRFLSILQKQLPPSLGFTVNIEPLAIFQDMFGTDDNDASPLPARISRPFRALFSLSGRRFRRSRYRSDSDGSDDGESRDSDSNSDDFYLGRSYSNFSNGFRLDDVYEFEEAIKRLKTLESLPSIEHFEQVVVPPVVNACKELKVLKDRQQEWLNKYASALKYSYRHKAEHSDLCEEADPAREQEFKQLCDQLYQEMLVENAIVAQQQKWRSRLPNVLNDAIRVKLVNSDAYKSGDPNREAEMSVLLEQLQQEHDEEQRLKAELEAKRVADIKELLLKTIPLELYNRSQKSPILMCARCSFCSSVGATLDRMLAHACGLENIAVKEIVLLEYRKSVNSENTIGDQNENGEGKTMDEVKVDSV